MLAALLALVVLLGCATPQVARPVPDPPASDLLNAVLWMQRSAEFKASALTAFALARIRLDQALADPAWTGAPREQTGAYQALPPAVILDLDETILDNSGYQAWMTLRGTTFDPKTWNAYVNTVTSLAVPGALEFARYADAKGRQGHRERWGREWIVIANPAYGSFESAPFGHDFKLSDGERRRLKRAVLDAWPGP